MLNATILVVDDEALIRWSLAERLKADGCHVLEAETGAAALEQLAEGVDLVLLDYKLPDTDGVTVLRKIKEFDQDILVILLTAYASVETAVEAMKLGAYHFANKPFNLDEVAATVERALETTRLRREVRQFRTTAARPYSLHSIVGNSPAMTALRHLVARIATSPASTVLLTGESGTGKDLVAKVIHYTSERAARPFMNITCSALPEQLLESELFGHERGAFTDARLQKRGLLETADGGTVFLDEIGEMVPALQAKLLRFLEEKAFKRVGGAADIRVDVRVVAATNRNLEDEVGKGRFRTRPVLPAERPADCDPAAARTRGRRPAARRVLHRRLQRRVPQERARGQPRRLHDAAALRRGRATCVSCVTSSSARCCCPTRPARVRDFARWATRGGHGGRFELPANGVDLEQLERSLVDPGAQALRRQPDARGRAPRHEPRPDPLSHREVRPAQGRVLSERDRTAGRGEGRCRVRTANNDTTLTIRCGIGDEAASCDHRHRLGRVQRGDLHLALWRSGRIAPARRARSCRRRRSDGPGAWRVVLSIRHGADGHDR